MGNGKSQSVSQRGYGVALRAPPSRWTSVGIRYAWLRYKPHVEIREGILDPLGVRVRKKELLMDNVVGLTIVVSGESNT